MDFLSLMSKARQAASLVAEGVALATEVKAGAVAIKGTLSETQQSELDATLADIHAQNMSLSGDIDAAAETAKKKR